MNATRTLILTLILSGASFLGAKAQNYETSLGLRGPLNNGITIKHFIGEQSALEGILAARYRGFSFTGLYEKHQNAFDVDQLQWYYGAGGHIGSWADGSPWFDDPGQNTVIGVDGIIGLEYTIEEIPFNISIDYKPAFNLLGHQGFWFDNGGISVRYIFGRN